MITTNIHWSYVDQETLEVVVQTTRFRKRHPFPNPAERFRCTKERYRDSADTDEGCPDISFGSD